MKRMGLLLTGLVVMCMACATVSKSPIPLSPTAYSELKGTWEGFRMISFDKYLTQNIVELEIQNDSVPLKGKLVIFPLPGQTVIHYPFDQGEIKEGKLFIVFPKDISMELFLYKEEKSLKLEGNFNYKLTQGKISLTKK
jgi:hypothetical protein